MNLREWGDEEARQSALALEQEALRLSGSHRPALASVEAQVADRLLASVPGLAARLRLLEQREPTHSSPSVAAGAPVPVAVPVPRRWQFARWLWEHGRLGEDCPG